MAAKKKWIRTTRYLFRETPVKDRWEGAERRETVLRL
jgi:hypothetical protein